jgi:hypothetical protein
MYLQRYNINSKIKPSATTYPVFYRTEREMLFEYCLKLFTWSGLPKSIPAKEIETRLFLYGMCGINKGKTGDLIATYVQPYGVTEYFDEFTDYNWSTPCSAGNCKIGVDGIIIDNDMLRNETYSFIHLYASKLAHADVSYICGMVNGRSTSIFKAISKKFCV